MANKIDETERAIEQAVDEVRATPGKISKASSEFVAKKISETEQAIERTVEGVTAGPKKIAEKVRSYKCITHCLVLFRYNAILL